jgi:ubiquinone/menaquinone biosynthesis C-methylase UbiE
MMVHLALERLACGALERIPEPEPVMLDEAHNAAFRDAGREDGVLAFLYLYHAIHVSSLIRPGERVLDLACGPANQLVQIARLHPESHFVGLDASVGMLQEAHRTLARRGVTNVELVEGDMTRLDGIASASVDCVLCTMSLHHMPDRAALALAIGEARRVLRDGGGAYFADFGRLKRRGTQRYFANDWDTEQSAAFTQDYLDSLRAAFSREELQQAMAPFGNSLEAHVSALAPFMVIFTSGPRHAWAQPLRQRAHTLFQELGAAQQRKFEVFARWMSAGGWKLPMKFDAGGLKHPIRAENATSS